MASNQAPVVDRIRIIPRAEEFLNRNVGASGEIFYDRDSSSLRLYNGNDKGGLTVATLDPISGTIDLSTSKNKIRAEWDTLANLTSEVNATTYQGMVAYVQADGILYYAHGGTWNPIAGGGGASVDVGINPPEEPEAGNIWFNSNNGNLYVYVDDGDSSQWVQPATPGVDAFSSITLSDSSQLYASGSDTLNFVDGPGIEITNDSTNNTIIISATGALGLAEGGDATFNTVSASEFINTGTGAPEFDSASSITLSAPDGVLINSGTLRLSNLTNAQRDAIIASNGDMIYNTDNNNIQAYVNGSWVVVSTEPIV